MDCCSSLPEWLTAIGTLLAVLIALFLKPLRDLINRPKIIMSHLDNKQCRVEVKSNADNSDDSKQLRIRIKLENNGNCIAQYAALFVDSYYQMRAGEGSYLKNEITPKQIKDYRNNKPSSIAPHLLYFFDVASINQYESLTTQDDGNKAKQFYKLYLLGEGEPLQLGKGTFVIPLKFYSSRINVKIAYLRVFWNSDSYNLEKRFFSAEILTEKEFKKLKIVE